MIVGSEFQISGAYTGKLHYLVRILFWIAAPGDPRERYDDVTNPRWRTAAILDFDFGP